MNHQLKVLFGMKIMNFQYFLILVLVLIVTNIMTKYYLGMEVSIPKVVHLVLCHAILTVLLPLGLDQALEVRVVATQVALERTELIIVTTQEKVQKMLKIYIQFILPGLLQILLSLAILLHLTLKPMEKWKWQTAEPFQEKMGCQLDMSTNILH